MMEIISKYVNELVPVGAPSYHLIVEAVLFIWVMWLIMRKKKHPEDKIILTHEEEEQIIKAWKPKPLVESEGKRVEEGDGDAGPSALELWGPVQGRPGKYLTIDGAKYLNLATNNYLGLVDEPLLDVEAERCIRRYGVGSCGPRGFYGTVDVHIELEDRIAKFLNLEETALYSFGFSTIASAIPSYSKAGDVIFADENVNFSIQKGLQASRSNINYFKHNDIEDLERLLLDQVKADKKNPKKAKTIRRFCVIEGIYSKTGEMCRLKEIVTLCKQHKVRLFIDETLSFGVVGKTGRGVTEHFGVSVQDVDLISGSLEHACAAFGGFIVGSSFVVDHQRISGLGYCFSASLPPLLAGVGIQSLKIIEEKPEIIKELQENCKYMHRELQKIVGLEVLGNELSPVKHIMFQSSKPKIRETMDAKLSQLILIMKTEHKIALVKPTYLEKQEISVPDPSIRLTVNRLLSKNEIDRIIFAIGESVSKIG